MSSPPFLHAPDLKDDDPKKNGLMCFRDQTRECGPDCMAFCPPPPGDDYRDGQWANCRLLVDSYRGSKHLTILATQMNDLARLVRNDLADRARSIPAPRGG